MEENLPEIKTQDVGDSPQNIRPLEMNGQSSSSRKITLPRISRRLVIFLTIFLLALVVLIGWPLWNAYQDGRKALVLVQGIKEAAKSQDIGQTSRAITAAKGQIQKVESDLRPIAWTQYIPFFGGYTADLIHGVTAGRLGLEAGDIVVEAVKPYADLLGFKGQGSFTSGTAEDRLAKVVETLDKVTPQLDQVSDKMEKIQKEVDAIDPNRYPESFQGKPIRGRLVEFKNLIDVSSSFLTQARPMVKQLPGLMGAAQEKKYLILFQNDKELRPTGGFITAYAVFRIEKGKIHLESSDDIYKLDDTIRLHVTPPPQISTYLNVYGWRLRDANFSPDFLSSMKTFEDLYNSSTDRKNIDGIMAVDTDVLVKLMDVLGPISAYGTNFTTQKVPGCDCPMVIYELEKYADEPKNYERGSRKDIIGVLLSEILKKTLGSPKQVYGPLFQAILDEARQKHILIYTHNQDAQNGLEALNFAGRIKSVSTDYLHINDANLGGAKANLYIVPKVTQTVSVTSSGADVNLSIDYRYPHQADNCSLERQSGLCLAGIYRDYLRIYLPKGAAVKEARGFENKSTTFEDLNHTVVDGFFTVVPQGLAKIQIKYHVPGDFQSKGVYTSLIQKQPGTGSNRYKIQVNGHLQEFDLIEDKEVSQKL